MHLPSSGTTVLINGILISIIMGLGQPLEAGCLGQQNAVSVVLSRAIRASLRPVVDSNHLHPVTDVCPCSGVGLLRQACPCGEADLQPPVSGVPSVSLSCFRSLREGILTEKRVYCGIFKAVEVPKVEAKS